ncbi:MAG: thiamine pyrophosphate-dependent dehydrogenase E1 component subunit alpha [Candidatus Scalindua rubra]|uniref:Pyruvate dehydrogenase n=1 Tax=Candidatus Scalindua brodae TaxID=237368 RepID=A0A0B0EQ46_9BACT|nr:MAG: pyruvate dehydrogenase [Candidatus Scalindua brodae]MBZ0108983.1 thiamine pyrophosphate-dependent dehydrogenase E1 component subunit alpha [Candidatus Scalindua rubra]
MDYSKELLTKLYQTMLRIRYCEESLMDPIINGEIRCPVHLCTGQEAVAAGVGAALEQKDYIFGNHRSHGHYLAKGGGMSEMIAEIYGKETGCSKGRGGSMHLIDPQVGMLGSAPIVAGTISLALGAALASSIRKDNCVTVSFFGDGATGEGVLCESLNFAALKKLPIIFACENNFYSTHLPIEEIRVNNRIFGIGKPFGVKSFKIDGNDALKVYEYARRAVAHCRMGEGPVFLEFLTYRMRGHVGPDDNVQGTRTDIRPEAEIKKWKKKDPIKRIERFLLHNKILIKRELIEFHEQVKKEVDAAHDFASNSPLPNKEEIDKYVFEE